jgi:hypothetical protein
MQVAQDAVQNSLYSSVRVSLLVPRLSRGGRSMQPMGTLLLHAVAYTSHSAAYLCFHYCERVYRARSLQYQ